MALLTFLSRLYQYPDDVYDDVKSTVDLKKQHAAFYQQFNDGFCRDYGGKGVCVPNVHAFYHLQESREHSGPLHQTSTEPYESLYSVCRRAYKAGTPNVAKQIMRNFYMRDR